MNPIAFPPFQPHPLLRSGHAQTIVGAYLPVGRKPYRAVVRVVELDDGDRVVLHDDCPQSWKTGQRVVLMAHGLAGSHESGYMVRVAEKLNACGVRTFRKDLRGFGASFETARHHCHAGRSEDLARCLEYVADICPGSPVTAIGYSMSANMLLKLLGEIEDMAPPYLDSAVAVAPPIDLIHCAHNLRQGANRLYDWSFVQRLHRLVQRRRRAVPDLVDLQLRPLPRRLREFDDQYTAPLSGFSGARQYYSQASAAPYLASIRVPTLIITAEDDPVVPVSMFERHPLSSATTLHVTRYGGHIGYVGIAGVDPDRRWLDWRIVQWVQARDRLAAPPCPLATSSRNPAAAHRLD